MGGSPVPVSETLDPSSTANGPSIDAVGWRVGLSGRTMSRCRYSTKGTVWRSPVVPSGFNTYGPSFSYDVAYTISSPPRGTYTPHPGAKLGEAEVVLYWEQGQEGG